MKLFNTTYEMSLRLLVFLSQYEKEAFSIDQMSVMDFIITYGAVFGISDVNLHGNNRFKFSEYSNRRNLVKSATKSLTLKGLIEPQLSDEGFKYSITNQGITYINAFESVYSHALREMSVETYIFTKDKSETELVALVHKNAIESLTPGGTQE